MPRPNATALTLCCLFAALALPPSAAADQITITGGFMQMQQPQGQLSLVGERGFSLEARPLPINGFWMPWSQCTAVACVPGLTVSLAGGWSASAVSGQLTFEGVTYNDLGGGDDFAPQATVLFDGSFVTPPLAPTAVLTAPFVFSGFFYTSPDEATHTLTGAGTATISLHEYDSAFWTVDGVRYQFASPQPVPEPATMFLVGLGAMVMARRLNKRPRNRATGPAELQN